MTGHFASIISRSITPSEYVTTFFTRNKIEKYIVPFFLFGDFSTYLYYREKIISIKNGFIIYSDVIEPISSSEKYLFQLNGFHIIV